jgi:hypothetical protein
VRQQFFTSVWLPGQQQPGYLACWPTPGCISGAKAYSFMYCSGMGRTLATSRVVVSLQLILVLTLCMYMCVHIMITLQVLRRVPYQPVQWFLKLTAVV